MLPALPAADQAHAQEAGAQGPGDVQKAVGGR